MLIAKKGNKILSITESETKTLQALGFDIIEQSANGDEEILLHGHGKTVAYAEYDKVIKERDAAKAALNTANARIAELEAAKPKARAKK